MLLVRGIGLAIFDSGRGGNTYIYQDEKNGFFSGEQAMNGSPMNHYYGDVGCLL